MSEVYTVERRRSQRAECTAKTHIVSTTNVIACEVLDVSDHGARVVMQSPVFISGSFVLEGDDTSASGCRVAWQRGIEMGVSFG